MSANPLLGKGHKDRIVYLKRIALRNDILGLFVVRKHAHIILSQVTIIILE